MTTVNNIKNKPIEERCYYCNILLTSSNRTIDHKIPLTRGGSNTADNKVLCCKACNKQKSDFTPEEFIFYKQVKKQYSKVLTKKSFNELLDRLGLYRDDAKRNKRNAFEYKVMKGELLNDYYRKNK